MCSFFDDVDRELREESKICLPELNNIISIGTDSFYKDLSSISKPVLVLLLTKSIEKIAFLQNAHYYEEDVMDNLCDCEFVFEDLVNESIEHCKLFIEKKL